VNCTSSCPLASPQYVVMIRVGFPNAHPVPSVLYLPVKELRPGLSPVTR